MKAQLIPWLILATVSGAFIPVGSTFLMGKERPQTNLVMILVDGMRNDALSNSAGSAHTPNLDRLARSGIAFPSVYSHSSSPEFSLASLMTGRHHDENGMAENGELDSETPVLAEWLFRRGYQTSAFVMDPDLDDSGLLQGFAHREVLPPTALEPEDGAFESGFSRALDELDPGKAFFFMGHVKWGERLQEALAAGATNPQENLSEIRHQYKRAVEDLDRAVGVTIEQLKAHDLYDNTLIVVTSLHGLSLGEHGNVGEVPSLYDEALHVPLIVRLPLETEWRDSLRANHPRFSRQVDIAPTIVELLGVAAMENTSGVSLLLDQERVLRAFDGGTDQPCAMRDDQYKLTFDPAAGEFEMYNLAQDPAELDNVFHVQGHLRKDWQDVLAPGQAALADAPEAAPAEERTPVSATPDAPE